MRRHRHHPARTTAGLVFQLESATGLKNCAQNRVDSGGRVGDIPPALQECPDARASRWTVPQSGANTTPGHWFNISGFPVRPGCVLYCIQQKPCRVERQGRRSSRLRFPELCPREWQATGGHSLKKHRGSQALFLAGSTRFTPLWVASRKTGKAGVPSTPLVSSGQRAGS